MKKLLYFFSFAIVSTIFWALPTPTLAVCECTILTPSPGGFSFQNATVPVPMPESLCRQRTDCTWTDNTPSPATPAPNSSNNTQVTDDGTIIVDARCHTQTQCITSRQSIGIRGDALSEGFVSTAESEAACAPLAESSGEDVGFCLAGSDATTNVTFFGRREFRSIGDFISYIYSISTGVAATLAVIVLIVSGIQIMTAGGNTSTVSSAKKRIGGAVAGLVLLGTAYVILRTINPALVELRQPSVYMINQQIINPIEASEEQLCDPDGTGPFGGCPADQYCMPMAGMSLEESLDGPCDIVAVALVVAPAVIATLGSASTIIATYSSFSTFLSAAVTRGAAVPINYVAMVAGRSQVVAKLLSFGGMGIRTVVKGATYAGGAVVLYNTPDMIEATDRFISARGICQPRGSGLRAGDICSTDPNASNTCADNMPCVPDSRIQGSMSCWGPSALGFCSSGRNGAVCEDDSHCKTAEGYTCFEKDWGGTLGKRKSCSNGGEGAYCNTNAVNASGQGDCATGLTCVSGICTKDVATQEFDSCQTTANCDALGAGYACFRPNTVCGLTSINNSLGSKYGVCLKRTSGGPEYRNGVYETQPDENGLTIQYNNGHGINSLFRRTVLILNSRQERMTFTGRSCGSNTSAWLESLNSPYITVNRNE